MGGGLARPRFAAKRRTSTLGRLQRVSEWFSGSYGPR